ncbi:MAG: hypothetical protein ABIG92_07565 [Candidatus Omnitrophota bacterium]
MSFLTSLDISPGCGVIIKGGVIFFKIAISCEMIFNASASITIGFFIFGNILKTNLLVSLSQEIPGPMIKVSTVSIFSRIYFSAFTEKLPSFVSGRGYVMASISAASMDIFNDLGTPRVTSPAPERRADLDESIAAPVRPRDPARINTWPKSPL